MMRQAIETKFFGPGNVRGSRVKAICDAGSITLDWNHRLNGDENHIAAAQALATKLKWPGEWYGGGLPGDGRGSRRSFGYAFVWAGPVSSGRRDPAFCVEHVEEAA